MASTRQRGAAVDIERRPSLLCPLDMQPRASQAYKPRQSTKPGLKALSSSTAGAVPAPSASVASYPILDAPTVAECLRSMRVSMVQEEDLKQPLAGTIQAVWAVLLHEFSGVTMDGLERPKGALVGMMPYPVSSSF